LCQLIQTVHMHRLFILENSRSVGMMNEWRTQHQCMTKMGFSFFVKPRAQHSIITSRNVMHGVVNLERNNAVHKLLPTEPSSIWRTGSLSLPFTCTSRFHAAFPLLEAFHITCIMYRYSINIASSA
jgi:hypothetical protein